MPKFAVSTINFIGDADIKLELVEAKTWREALARAKSVDDDAMNSLPEGSQEEARSEANNQDWDFRVVEVLWHPS